MAATGGMRALAVAGFIPRDSAESAPTVEAKVCVTHAPVINWYARFLTGPDVMPFSPVQKLRLAADNLTNPFNLVTITGEAAISVAADSHSAYGPGFPGWGRNVGVSFTQDMTSQFFGTFVIPSITHTDPHYHRRPDLSIPRRAFHCVYQIFWQRADNGRHTLNYSQIFGPMVDMSLANLYVPGQETHFSADAERYAVDLATAPIDNFITEFVPIDRQPHPPPRCLRPAPRQPYRHHRQRAVGSAKTIRGLQLRNAPSLRTMSSPPPHSPPPIRRSLADFAIRCTFVGLTGAAKYSCNESLGLRNPCRELQGLRWQGLEQNQWLFHEKKNPLG